LKVVHVPGEWYPYILTDALTLGANASGTLMLSVGATEEFQGAEIFFVETSTFSITGITDSSGKPYTNADATNLIASTLFDTALDQRSDIGKFMVPLQLPPNTMLSINVTDTSGAGNTIYVYINGKKRSV
jgi:hypothetical protein